MKKYAPKTKWYLLVYLDGPLARRTAIYGFYKPEEIPEYLTAYAGRKILTKPGPRPGERVNVYDGNWRPMLADPGYPVKYQLTDGGYVHVGDGSWDEEFAEEATTKEFPF